MPSTNIPQRQDPQNPTLTEATPGSSGPLETSSRIHPVGNSSTQGPPETPSKTQERLSPNKSESMEAQLM